MSMPDTRHQPKLRCNSQNTHNPKSERVKNAAHIFYWNNNQLTENRFAQDLVHLVAYFIAANNVAGSDHLPLMQCNQIDENEKRDVTGGEKTRSINSNQILVFNAFIILGRIYWAVVGRLEISRLTNWDDRWSRTSESWTVEYDSCGGQMRSF